MAKSSAKSARRVTRIMIVEDHPMTRDGLVQLLSGESDLKVLWKAQNAREALEALNKEEPDLILTDLTLPDKNGLELIKDAQALRPNVPILVISMHEESLYAERALRAGARGYITKDAGGEKLMHAVRQVLAGAVYVSEKTTTRLLEALSGKVKQSASPISQLSDREFEVYDLIGRGKSTKEIAQRLHLSDKTVAVHRENIKRKLQIGSSAELTHHAIRWVEGQASGSRGE